MWLITDKGFLSVVAYDATKDRHNKRSKRQLKSFGPRPVLVRARVEDHLLQLKPYWSKVKIEKDICADYEFRAIMPRTRWIEFLTDAGDSIDYDSHFKEVVRSRVPGNKKAKDSLYSAMMRIWSVLAGLQPDAPYGGWAATSTLGTKGFGYGGLFKDKPKGSVSNHGYTASGVKSAADSAAVFQGRTGYFSGSGSWVERSEAADYSAASAVSTRTARSADMGQAPDTVLAMAKMLLEKEPEEIFVDLATPGTAQSLWDEAMSLYGRQLDPEELSELLNDLCNDLSAPAEEAEEFYEAYEYIITKYNLLAEPPSASVQKSIAQEAVTLLIAD